jgi:hypothetical protein
MYLKAKKMKTQPEKDYEMSEDDLINQMINSAQLDEVSEDVDYWEKAYLESMIDAQREDAMIEAHLEAQFEDNILEAQFESQLEDAMIEAYLDSQFEDAMLYRGYTADSKESQFYLYDNNFETSVVPKFEPNENIIFAIYKKFCKTSGSGKTAYFEYKVLDKNKSEIPLVIDAYRCNGADEEHWVSWKYSDDQRVEVNHYVRELTGSQGALYYPFEYNYAKLIALNKLNPCNFHFQKLDFFVKDNAVNCGDKFSTCKIESSTNYQNFYMKDFALDIVNFMKSATKYSSLNEFILVSMLRIAVDHLEKLEFISNSYKEQSIKNIIIFTDELVEARLRYIKNQVKLDSESELNLLLEKYELIKYRGIGAS